MRIITAVEIILRMYDDLQAGHSIKLIDVCRIYDISIPTFHRYIALLRSYLWQEHTKTLVYHERNNEYRIQEEENIII